MNKQDFEFLSDLRIQEAKVLLDNGCFPGAYYLAGYAVECALKACICKRVQQYDFPDRDLSQGSYTHDLNKLLKTAPSELRTDHEIKLNHDAAFTANWFIVKQWSEQARYNCFIHRQMAEDLYNAITEEESGILTWLKAFW
jgi:HEPN domain-containing protein